MNRLEQILSRPTAKPYRSGKIEDVSEPHLNESGHLEFDEQDVENPKNWSIKRKLYISEYPNECRTTPIRLFRLSI